MTKKIDVTFDGTSLSEEFGIGLINYKKRSSSRKTRGIDVPGRDGMYKVNSAFSPLSIDLNVVVEGATTKDVHKKIRMFLSWLSQQNEPKVTFTDDPDVFVRADLDSASEYTVTKGMDNAMTYLTISLYQYDPFTYDNGIISYSLEVAPNEVYDILNEGLYTPYMIYLSGTENALTEYLATGLGTNNLSAKPIASNITVNINGIQQMYEGTIGVEDVLVIDGMNLMVLKNGESAISNWQGNIEDLLNGMNTFVMSNTEGIPLFARIEFYRRWL